MHSRIVIYFYTQIADGQRKIISQLEKQIENVRKYRNHTKKMFVLWLSCHNAFNVSRSFTQEGKDKKFLIAKLQNCSD